MATFIHPTAIVHPSAVLGEDVEIGPYVVIEEDVRIGRGTSLMARAYIGKHTTLGEENKVHVGAVLGHAPQDISTSGKELAHLVIGDRNVFREYCTVHRGSHEGNRTIVGSDCFLMTHCHVAHDCRIGNRVIIAGGALLAGHIHVEDRAFISGNATVHQFCRIGTLCMISGLARVDQDAPPYFMIKGDSAVYGLNKVGLARAGVTAEETEQIRGAYKILYRRGYPISEALRRIEEGFSASPHVKHLVEFLRGCRRNFCRHHRRGSPKE
ncbi:MAG: acyl-ACP--UDP-N-acetylglucosamine O-acyltransferase [Planctomycetes bacterium]|jgi:UDP-N-acetylglucosamine acyltransferase|nr:acyl-ACP--UDP-N-acetylglucosamine O-acyltransferase [Planctomycetota bacterium]